MLIFAVQVILLLMVLGGVIAFFGNYVGRLIGKKRLTIVNLRPRHTATAITVISGALIAFFTIGVILAISQDARLALLGLDQLKIQIKEKTRELKEVNRKYAELRALLADAKKEIQELLQIKDKLDQEIKTAREGQVLFRVGEVISLSLIQAGPESGKIEAGLEKIIADADAYVHSLGINSDQRLVTTPADDFNQALFSLMEDRKIYIVKLVATRNVLWGEDVPVRFEISENKLVYREDEVIAEMDLPPRLSASEAEGEITGLLRLIHQNARNAGVVPDPGGSMGAVPYSQIFELAKKIKGSSRVVNLKGLAEKNIYAIGPLTVKFKVAYK
jgi:uncharacterized protein (DUF3084 family)